MAVYLCSKVFGTFDFRIKTGVSNPRYACFWRLHNICTKWTMDAL